MKSTTRLQETRQPKEDRTLTAMIGRHRKRQQRQDLSEQDGSDREGSGKLGENSKDGNARKRHSKERIVMLRLQERAKRL
jgi:hypothetical protein